MTAPDPVEHWDWERDFDIQPDRLTSERRGALAAWVTKHPELAEMLRQVESDVLAADKSLIIEQRAEHREQQRQRARHHRRIVRLLRTAAILIALGALGGAAIAFWGHR